MDIDSVESFEAWEPENLEESCALLRQNDPSMTKVDINISNFEHVNEICSAIRNNTVVRILNVDCRNVEPEFHGCLNRYVLMSPSLQELVFNTANGSNSLGEIDSDDHNSLQFVNLLLSAVGGSAPIQSLGDVPLCQSTALAFTNALTINRDKLWNVNIDFPCEASDEDAETHIQEYLAPEVAQAILQSNLESLCLNWLEHERFPTGEAFFPALAGHLPLSLRLLELSNFVESDVTSGTIADMIEQSGHNLDSILFSFCMFGDANFRRILGALEKSKTNLKVLHYGYLHEGTAPVLAQSIAKFGCLEELGVGFHDDMDAFELFCEKIPYTATLKSLDVQVFNLHNAPMASRLLRALAVALPKLPNLNSVTTIFTYDTVDLEDVPLEFLEALEAHENLVDLTSRIRYGNNLVEYYLLRNRFRDQLASTKPVMLEAFRALDTASPASVSLVKETLCSRGDCFLKGLDEGCPMPPSVEKAPSPRRFQKGKLF